MFNETKYCVCVCVKFDNAGFDEIHLWMMYGFADSFGPTFGVWLAMAHKFKSVSISW